MDKFVIHIRVKYISVRKMFSFQNNIVIKSVSLSERFSPNSTKDFSPEIYTVYILYTVYTVLFFCTNCWYSTSSRCQNRNCSYLCTTSLLWNWMAAYEMAHNDYEPNITRWSLLIAMHYAEAAHLHILPRCGNQWNGIIAANKEMCVI